MTRRSESSHTASDGITQRRLTWLPDEGIDIRGLVLLSHGLGEHVGRYDHVADALTARGFAMSGADHRGHGRSEGLRGHVDGFSQYTADLGRVLDAFRAEHPDLPVVLYGHSMGGLISLHFNLDRPDHGLAGLALSNPQLGIAFEPPKLKVAAGRLLSRLLPRLRLGNELSTADLSRDPVEVKKYEDDPLVHGLISTRWFTSMTAAMDRVNAEPQGVQVPALFLLGASDKIVSAKAAQEFAARLEPARTTVKVWPGSYHEPHNDLDRDEVIGTLVDWCEERLTG